ncbi:AraC family transcriptional regulator [Anaerolentibacter hominis]|uniref:helix-turn-helix transcriptional regulator n=1 Tax=Anaerolentibacter hominis TaxID=3079009 RepID=UPI0031B81672
MAATQREKNIYGKDVQIISRKDDCTVYRLSDETGEVIMTSYMVFPGIELIYNDVHIQHCGIENTVLGNILEINHCREGRIECEFKDEFCYLAPGDMVIAKKEDAGHSSYFPLSHYHGITITIDMDRAPACLSCILDDVNVRPSALIRKFCSEGSCFVARSKPCLEHIFSELYSVREEIRRGYFKIKVLELLLFLSGMEIEKEKQKKPCYSAAQVTIAKSVCRYLTEHMENKITLEQLAERFHVSGSQIKNSFRGVYGVSVYSYIRTQKMQAAGLMLTHGDGTILEIAGRFGYDNGSKFASAFKDVMGVTPSEYRALWDGKMKEDVHRN